MITLIVRRASLGAENSSRMTILKFWSALSSLLAVWGVNRATACCLHATAILLRLILHDEAVVLIPFVSKSNVTAQR